MIDKLTNGHKNWPIIRKTDQQSEKWPMVRKTDQLSEKRSNGQENQTIVRKTDQQSKNWPTVRKLTNGQRNWPIIKNWPMIKETDQSKKAFSDWLINLSIKNEHCWLVKKVTNQKRALSWLVGFSTNKNRVYCKVHCTVQCIASILTGQKQCVKKMVRLRLDQSKIRWEH